MPAQSGELMDCSSVCAPILHPFVCCQLSCTFIAICTDTERERERDREREGAWRTTGTVREDVDVVTKGSVDGGQLTGGSACQQMRRHFDVGMNACCRSCRFAGHVVRAWASLCLHWVSYTCSGSTDRISGVV